MNCMMNALYIVEIEIFLNSFPIRCLLPRPFVGVFRQYNFFFSLACLSALSRMRAIEMHRIANKLARAIRHYQKINTIP